MCVRGVCGGGVVGRGGGAYYYYYYYSSVLTSYTISTAVRGRARGERARGELTEGGEAVWPASCTYPPYCPGGG